ncbi:hypothetical protein [Actinophytocola sp.]|uniref:hypothetical protein n=1 Tax=Actinophytocola sp. TaxID=1872138 RepID=UPI00389AE5CE
MFSSDARAASERTAPAARKGMPDCVPESSWRAWSTGAYRTRPEFMQPVNELSRWPRGAVVKLAHTLFGEQQGAEVMHALTVAMTVRDPKHLVTMNGVQVPVGAFGASFSRLVHEVGRRDAAKPT